MPQLHKGWLYPPTRREVTLILFSLTVFILSYNLEASLQLVGVKPAKLSGSYLSAIGECRFRYIGRVSGFAARVSLFHHLFSEPVCDHFQGSEGTIPGMTEMEEDQRNGETSWKTSLPASGSGRRARQPEW